MAGTGPQRDDDPLASALASVRITELIQRDLGKEAERPGLPPGEAREIEAASDRLVGHLRNIDGWVDQHAAVNRSPATTYLLGPQPQPYPQNGPIAEKMVWFATETWRLAENIHRRLGIDRTARAEQALRDRASRADEPARLTREGDRMLAADPHLKRMMDQGRLPATRDLLESAAEQQRRGKLRKRPPAKETADVSIAVAAALAMPGEGRHLEHRNPVTEDRNLGLLNDATVSLGLAGGESRRNSFAEISRMSSERSSSEQRGRVSSETPLRPAVSPTVSRASTVSRR